MLAFKCLDADSVMYAQATLSDEGFDNDAAFDAAIKKLEAYLKKSKKKDAEGEEMDEEPPSFPLVDVPDADVWTVSR